MDQTIDYEALERNVEANKMLVGPGIVCDECSAGVPPTYVLYKKIYYPAGRPHGSK